MGVKDGSSATVDLTDASGKSYVYLTEGTSNLKEVTPANPTCDYEGLTWSVSYSGPASTKEGIALEWAELLSRYPTADVQVVSDDGNTHVLRFGAADAAASACTNGPKVLADNVNLSSITWGSNPTETGSGTGVFTVSQDISAKLTASAFAVAITGTAGNEGTTAGNGTHGLTVSTVLNAA